MPTTKPTNPPRPRPRVLSARAPWAASQIRAAEVAEQIRDACADEIPQNPEGPSRDAALEAYRDACRLFDDCARAAFLAVIEGAPALDAAQAPRPSINQTSLLLSGL